QLGIGPERILFWQHHQSHAAAAFLTAPVQRAAILTADGVGEWATLTLGRGEIDSRGQARLEISRELRFPHSLGMLYSTFTAYLGFPVNEGEYKVMGLAAYGRPAYEELLWRIVRRTADGGIALDLSYFDFHQGARQSWSRKLVAELGPPRHPWQAIDPSTPDGQRCADIAASVQRVLEEILVDLARQLQRETGLPDLCLGGGVALNGVANARILRESGFSNLYVPPAPGDAGCAIGAALYADRIHFGRRHGAFPDHPYWGPVVDASDLAHIAAEDGFEAHRLTEPELLPRIAEELTQGRIVGWMQGACELGPRALGNRSVLAAPHDASMREHLNRSIKYREEFRPFAPAVPIELADHYFDLPRGGARLARFLSGVFPVRPEWRGRLGAITHVDGSARLQTLEHGMAPRLYALLEAYGRRSGLPVLLNTSFNVAGEPIVTRALEGYSTFRRCGIDVLAAGPTLVAKRAASPTGPLKEDVACWSGSMAG